jgi:hypothetical protein
LCLILSEGLAGAFCSDLAVIAVLLILLISGFSLISYDLFSARLNFCSDAGTYAHGNHRASHAIPNPQLAAMGAYSQVPLAPRLFSCAQRQQPQPGVVPLLERRGVCGRLDGSHRVGSVLPGRSGRPRRRRPRRPQLVHSSIGPVCCSQYSALPSGAIWLSIDGWREEEIWLNIQGKNFSSTNPKYGPGMQRATRSAYPDSLGRFL